MWGGVLPRCEMKNTGVTAQKTIRIFVMSLALLLFCLSASAQLNLGRILGSVTDETGGAIVGATVTVTDIQRGVSRTLTTDEAGQYSAPSLNPGTYSVRAEAKGFKVLDRTGIDVGVGQDVRIDLTLQPGEQTQTVTVTGEAPLVNSTNATLGGTLENQTLNEVPLNGRDYLYLVTYRPGILLKPGGNTNNALTSYGGRPEETIFLFDGLWNNNILAGGKPIIGGGGTAGADQQTILPIDAIQEVNIEANPKAEFGWNPGAQINVGLKSGTNSIHGTAYAFGRDADLNAKNPFLSPTQPKAAMELKQYGASIGGPIKKDKLFYFGAYEGDRYVAGVPKTDQEPTTLAGAGVSASFPDAIAAMNAAHQPLSQLSLNLAGCTAAGVCNAANGIFGNATSSSTYPISLNTSGGSDNAIGRVDYHLNDHNSINGEFFYGKGTVIGASVDGEVQPYWRGDNTQNVEVARAVWIWTPNSSWVNEARFGFDRSYTFFLIYECEHPGSSPNYTNLGFIAGTSEPQYITTSNCAFPDLTISGFSALGNASAQSQPQKTYQGIDTVSHTYGKHVFKFGGEVRTIVYPGAQDNNVAGVVNFGSVAAFAGATALEDFLSGVPASGTLGIGNPNRNLLTRYVGAFIEDDWRILPRLTLNLGLRWEYQTPYSDSNNQIANFDPTRPTGLVQATSSNSLYTTDPHNFGPRLGLAWDLTGKATTVLRAGAGVAFAHPPLQDYFGSQGAQLNLNPTGFSLVLPNGTVTPGVGNIQTGTQTFASQNLPWALNTPVFNGSTSGLTCGNGVGKNPAPCMLQAINPNIRNGYVTTWSLGVQHAFTNNLSLDVSYVGNHGTGLVTLPDINIPTPGAKNGSGASAIGPPPTGGYIEQSRRPYNTQFPYFASIEYFTNGDQANYNGLQTNLTERASHGLSFTFGYTFAHSLDYASAETTDTFMNQACLKCEYGDSTQDERHSVHATLTYIIPGHKAPGQMLEGWEFNSVVTVLSPLPYNAADTTSDISGTGRLLDRWTMVGSAGNFDGLNPLLQIPCYGAAGSSFAKTANCITGLPAACISAAAAEATGPGGTTGTSSLNSLGCYMVGSSVIVPPAQGTFGTMGRDVLRAFPENEWDMSLSKNWKFTERFGAQFRGEFFNIINHRSFSAPNSNPNAPSSFGQSQSTPNTTNPVIGNFSPREIQLGLKLLF